MMRVVVATSIEVFGREEWNHLFPHELEDWSYYRAAESSRLADFSWLYFGVRVDGRLLAALPAFLTDYELDTTLTGPLRRATEVLTRWLPRLLRQRMLALGSPVTEFCHLGFAPDVSPAEQRRLLDAILAQAEDCARKHGVRMIAVKDSSAEQDLLWTQAAKTQRLRRQPGLPTAFLDVRYASIDEYLGSLSKATRKDMRRKLKAAAELRVEWRHNIDDVTPEIMRLYQATYANAKLSFEELTPEYFRSVLRDLGARASCVLYWLGPKLVAFNLVLHDGQRLLDKFLGMDYAVARDHNLYFCTWIENVRYCIDHGVPLYQSGQGLHAVKVRLGSRLRANWLWYRHRNRVLDAILALVERVARLDRHDPELATLLKQSHS
jgi:predicted N-acyltransferase